jgi:hypothetical protein
MNPTYDYRKACLVKVLILVIAALSFSCAQVTSLNEAAYVAPERLKLRSSTAPASRVLAELKSGDRVTITVRANAEDGTPWAKVDGPGGESGWAEARYFVKEGIVEEARRIAEQVKDIQTQAIGKSKATLKLRLTPDRTSEDNVATFLPSGTTLEIVGRERKPRPANLTSEAEGDAASGKSSKGAPEIKFDDWLLVRLKDYAVLTAGWIYGGSVGLEIPSEIVYFGSSGRRITGWQKIATVPGNDSKSGDHYLVMERKVLKADEQADFDRVKVLAYDPDSRNYTTPFREDVTGRYPVTLRMTGTRGQFQLNVIDQQNQLQKITYEIEMLDGGRVKVSRSSINN